MFHNTFPKSSARNIRIFGSWLRPLRILAPLWAPALSDFGLQLRSLSGAGAGAGTFPSTAQKPQIKSF